MSKFEVELGKAMAKLAENENRQMRKVQQLGSAEANIYVRSKKQRPVHHSKNSFSSRGVEVDIERLKELYKTDMNLEEIGKTMGFSRSKIMQALKDNNVPVRVTRYRRGQLP